MTISPSVELRFNPTDLRPGDLPRTSAYLGTPAEAFEAALATARVAVVEQMKEELQNLGEPTHYQLLRLADLAWQAAFWRYRKISAPIIADAYLRAYAAANAGEVPMSVIYDLADKHAEKVGAYFHESSRVALGEGFSTLVNRRVPARAAAAQVLEAYGLTPRQMRAYTAASTFKSPVASVVPTSIKSRASSYILRAFTTRTKKLSQQEEHNVSQQAQQFAWMWMQDKGTLTQRAQKMWITARDERVCPVCGPLHGQKVLVGQQFKTAQGDFWTPGLHPNCRCVVRLVENRFSIVGKADWWRESEHPRESNGRFGDKPDPFLQPVSPRPLPRTKTIDVDEEFHDIISRPVQGKLVPLKPQVDTETDEKFKQLMGAQTEDAPSFAPVFAPVAAAVSAPTFAAAKPDPVFAPATNTVVFKEAVQQAVFRVAPPEVMRDLATELVLDTREAVKTDPKPRLKPATLPLPSGPAYAVVTPENLENGDISRIRLNHGIDWATDEIAVAMEASEMVQKKVARALEDIAHEPHVFKAAGGPYQSDLRGEIDEMAVEEAVKWFARDAHGDHDDSRYPHFLGSGEDAEVEWFDKEGNYSHSETVPYEWIGRKYGLTHDQFKVYMVRVDERHDTGDPDDIEEQSGGANSRHRSFSMNGDYEMVPGTEGWSDDSHAEFKVNTYKITPSGIHDDPSE